MNPPRRLEVGSQSAPDEGTRVNEHDGRPRLGWWPFVRFAVVGTLCFVTGLVGVYLLTELLRWHYLVSTTVAVIAANVLGWLLNRAWTFELRTRRSLPEFLRYGFVNACAMAVSLTLVGVLVSGLGVHYLVACALVALAMAVVNFHIHGRWSLLSRRHGA